SAWDRDFERENSRNIEARRDFCSTATMQNAAAEQANGLTGELHVRRSGLGAENVADAIRQVQPFGLDVCSGVEEQPGKKDAKRVKQLMARIKRACRGDV